MRVQQHGNQHQHVAQKDGEDRLLPVHAAGDHRAGQHVGGNVDAHRDPQSSVVVGAPRAAAGRHRSQIFVVKRAIGNRLRVEPLGLVTRARGIARRAGHGESPLRGIRASGGSFTWWRSKWSRATISLLAERKRIVLEPVRFERKRQLSGRAARNLPELAVRGLPPPGRAAVSARSCRRSPVGCLRRIAMLRAVPGFRSDSGRSPRARVSLVSRAFSNTE